LDLTKSIVENFRKYAEASNIKLLLEAEPGIPSIRADRERISIVIQNLVDNAIRYTVGAGTIKISISRKNFSLLTTVEDQGIGIPPGLQSKIFGKFFRVGNLNKSDKQTHGSGIGLYIAKEIVRASGGEIGFTSVEGKGSTFWFRLPIK
jgi:signal transduction histidine kinase